jgi:membrane-bound serine protease (ClpP class)
MKLSLAVILPAVITTTLFFTAMFRLAFKAHKRTPVTGSEGLLGTGGIADTDITKQGGMVLLHGEHWAAFSDDPVSKGEHIIVESVSGLKVKVRKVDSM